MVCGRSCTNWCQEKGYCTWIANKMSYISVTVTTGWTSRLSARHFFYIPASSTICASQTRLLRTTVGRIHFLTVIQQSWDETWNCDVQEMKSLWVPPHRHSNTQLPQQLVMTSDWWWQWLSLSRKDALGQRISCWFAACRLVSTTYSLLPGFAFRAVHWLAGTVQLGPWWLDTCGGFLRREESGHEAGCSCWCSYGFMSSLAPTHHSGDRTEGAMQKLCAVNSW